MSTSLGDTGKEKVDQSLQPVHIPLAAQSSAETFLAVKPKQVNRKEQLSQDEQVNQSRHIISGHLSRADTAGAREQVSQNKIPAEFKLMMDADQRAKLPSAGAADACDDLSACADLSACDELSACNDFSACYAGTCRPCIGIIRGGECWAGVNCDFCHDMHWRARRKGKKERMRKAKWCEERFQATTPPSSGQVEFVSWYALTL